MSVRECLAAIAQPCVAHVLASANFAYGSTDPEGIPVFYSSRWSMLRKPLILLVVG